ITRAVMGSRGPLARQAPLHRLHAPGIAAAGDDAEIGARQFERYRLDVRFGGRLLDVGHLLRATGEPVPEELLSSLAAVGFRRRRLGGFPRLSAGFGGEVLAGVDDVSQEIEEAIVKLAL